MLLLLVGLAFLLPILWTLSVGALREARRARRLDPRLGCQAWVAVPGMRGRLYRCGEPVYAGGRWCLRHERRGPREAAEIDPDATPIDEPQVVARALVRARIGIPVAALVVVTVVLLAVWVLQRVW